MRPIQDASSVVQAMMQYSSLQRTQVASSLQQAEVTRRYLSNVSDQLTQQRVEQLRISVEAGQVAVHVGMLLHEIA